MCVANTVTINFNKVSLYYHNVGIMCFFCSVNLTLTLLTLTELKYKFCFQHYCPIKASTETVKFTKTI